MHHEHATVLLVEDNADHAELVLRQLSGLPFPHSVIHVQDGEEALDLLLAGGPRAIPRPHVILLDLRLPKVDGIEVLRTLKANERTSSIPVVVLSTSAAATDLDRAYLAHVNSYLVKPSELRDFEALLRLFGEYWLRRNVGAPPPVVLSQ